MKKIAKKPALVLSSIRLPEDMIKRVDKIAENMSEPGVRITRGEALRRVAYVGVEQLERGAKK